MWFSPYHQEKGAIHSNESDAMLAGRLVADVASAAIAAAELSVGVGGEGGGILACATGVGCPGGAAAMMAGAVLITQAAGTGARAAEGAGTSLAMFANRNERQIQNSIKNLGKRIDDHTKKLQAYIDDPISQDHKGLLKDGLPEWLREKIISGRIRSLETEIRKFESEIRKLQGLLK